jgi:hypothetical protein
MTKLEDFGSLCWLCDGLTRNPTGPGMNICNRADFGRLGSLTGPGIQAGRARDEMFIVDWANNRNRKALLGSEFYPSFDTSSPLDCYPQNHEILLNKDMKYLLRLRIKCASLKNIYNYSTHSSSSDWLKTFKKRKDRQFSSFDKCFFLITLLGTGGSLTPTYEKMRIDGSLILTFRCFPHRVPTSIT